MFCIGHRTGKFYLTFNHSAYFIKCRFRFRFRFIFIFVKIKKQNLKLPKVKTIQTMTRNITYKINSLYFSG